MYKIYRIERVLLLDRYTHLFKFFMQYRSKFGESPLTDIALGNMQNAPFEKVFADDSIYEIMALLESIRTSLWNKEHAI